MPKLPFENPDEEPMTGKDWLKYTLIGIGIMIVLLLATIGLSYLMGNYPPLLKY